MARLHELTFRVDADTRALEKKLRHLRWILAGGAIAEFWRVLAVLAVVTGVTLQWRGVAVGEAQTFVLAGGVFAICSLGFRRR